VRIWIDLSNSPHPLLFGPIARRLEESGHEVLLTARDHAQTADLARERWNAVAIIGGASPSSRSAKLGSVASRVRALHRWALVHRPDVAVSHNSYAQIVAARLVGVPAVTAMDYEHQPASHLAFRLSSTILLPEVFPPRAAARFGGTTTKVRRYPGLKELLYLGDFEPDLGVLADLGLSRGAGYAIVVTRPPPTGALYHRHGNDLYGEAISTLAHQANVRCVVLARTREQRERVGPALQRCLVPDRTVDARSLMHSADLMLGAGGTMTREAALLGVPTVSVFAGRPAAADTWLELRGLLRRLQAAEELAAVSIRAHEPRSVEELRREGSALIDVFAQAVTDTGGSRPWGRRLVRRESEDAWPKDAPRPAQ